LRLFVAVYPPAEAVRDVTAQVATLRIGTLAQAGVNVRLTRPETYHVTLAFLGEVDPQRLPAAEAALARAVAAWRPKDGSRVLPEVAFAGGGRFGRGAFTVLWIGLDGDVPALTRLAQLVRRELRRARLPYDHKAFRPHLTIARPGDRVAAEDIAADRETFAAYRGPAWPVTEVVLVRSYLGPRPRYERLGAWAL